MSSIFTDKPVELTYDTEVPPNIADWIKVHLIGVALKGDNHHWVRWIKDGPES